jgi:hypothetical protein
MSFGSNFSDYLTVIDPLQDKRRKLTHPGQANWALPSTDRVCRQCVHWDDAGGRQIGRDGHGILKPRACTKYAAMMRARGARVPHDAKACRFFEENPEAPAAQEKRRW